MSRPAAGAVVALWEGHDLGFGVIASDDGERLRVVRADAREEKVPATRVVSVVEPAGVAPGGTFEARRAASRRVQAVESRLRDRATQVDVPVIWDVVVDSEPPPPLGDLAALALGGSGADERVATVLALLRDGLHFVRRGDSWEPRTRAALEEIQRQRERTARRQEERAQALELVRAAAEGRPLRRSGSEGERALVEALEDLAVHDEACSAASRAAAMSALSASGLRWDRPDEGAFRLLRALGHFEDDDLNVQVLRYGLRTEFPPEALAAAAAAAEHGFRREGRTDLTGLEVVSIDAAHTREIDDALSAEPRPGGGVRLGIHIADPGAFVLPGDAVDAEAFARSVTHYLPDLRLTMLPPALSEGAASLLDGQERPALSFLVDLDPAGTVLGLAIEASVVRSRARIGYDEADAQIAGAAGLHAELLRRLDVVAAALEARRLEAGAVRIVAPEVDVHLSQAGHVELTRIDPGSRSRRLVSEAMVLAGACAARFCMERRIPAVFRRQAPPAGAGLPRGEVRDPVLVRRLRRALRRGEVATTPGPHHALGLPAYAQVSSPLRRFQDLATQRQIAAAIAGLPAPYDRETIATVAAVTERAEAEGRRAERASERYWLLRYLERLAGGSVEGIVVEVEPVTVVQLEETLLEERVPGLAEVSPGTRVRLRVERVNPRAERIVLRPELPGA